MSRSHKDPSGTLNKARWLLSKSKRDIVKLQAEYTRACYPRHHYDTNIFEDKHRAKSIYSWEAAIVMAQYCILHNIENPSDVFNALNFRFEKGTSLIQGDRRWYNVLLDYFNSFILPCLKRNAGITWFIQPSLLTAFNMYSAFVHSGDIKPNCFLKTTTEHMNSIKCHALEKKYNAPWRK